MESIKEVMQSTLARMDEGYRTTDIGSLPLAQQAVFADNAVEVVLRDDGLIDDRERATLSVIKTMLTAEPAKNLLQTRLDACAGKPVDFKYVARALADVTGKSAGITYNSDGRDNTPVLTLPRGVDLEYVWGVSMDIARTANNRAAFRYASSQLGALYNAQRAALRLFANWYRTNCATTSVADFIDRAREVVGALGRREGIQIGSGASHKLFVDDVIERVEQLEKYADQLEHAMKKGEAPSSLPQTLPFL